MKVNYQERIKETPSELKKLMEQQKKSKNYRKIQALYRLKSKFSLSVASAAEQMQVSESSIKRWLKQYQEGGLEKLLLIEPKSGRPKKVAPEIAAEIKKQLTIETGGFNSYKEIQTWVKENYQQEYAYGTLYDLVRQRWQAKLKVPRPCSIKQDPVAREAFKKNCLNS